MRRNWAALAGLIAVFAAGLVLAVGAFGARSDTPVKSQTYDDPRGDAPQQAPDIAGVVVDDYADGTLEFDVALPDRPVLPNYTSVIVLVDSDRSATTGDPQGYDYALQATGAGMSPPEIEFFRWQNNAWALASPMDGSFTGQVGVVFKLPALAMHISNAFDFEVRGLYWWSNANLKDDAPQNGNFSFTLAAPATTSTATTTTTTVTTTPKPKKKLPLCKKGKHSTKKHPCRKR
jgi:hypothetical protein